MIVADPDIEPPFFRRFFASLTLKLVKSIKMILTMNAVRWWLHGCSYFISQPTRCSGKRRLGIVALVHLNRSRWFCEA